MFYAVMYENMVQFLTLLVEKTGTRQTDFAPCLSPHLLEETEVSIHIFILEYRGNAYHSTLGLHFMVEVIVRRYFLTLTHGTAFYPRSLCSEGGLHLGTFLPFLDRTLSVQSTQSLTDAKEIF